MYVCMYVCINLYILITNVFNHLFFFIIIIIFNLLLCFLGCPFSLDAIGIRVLPHNLRSFSPFSITRTKCPSAKCICAANLVCKDVDIFMKRMTYLIQILRQSVALCNERIVLVLYLYYYIVTDVLSSSVCLVSRF